MLSVLDTGVLISSGNTRIEGDLGISAILRNFDPLPVDSYVAASYGRLASLTQAAGRKSRTRSMDLLIAVTAHAHGARLITSNVSDCSHLSEVLDIVEF
jgi:toxin FitB